jgi:hypothetical protein
MYSIVSILSSECVLHKQHVSGISTGLGTFTTYKFLSLHLAFDELSGFKLFVIGEDVGTL